MSRQKMFGRHGSPRAYTPHSEETKSRIGKGVREAINERPERNKLAALYCYGKELDFTDTHNSEGEASSLSIGRSYQLKRIRQIDRHGNFAEEKNALEIEADRLLSAAGFKV